jgi:hypothetical protein
MIVLGPVVSFLVSVVFFFPLVLSSFSSFLGFLSPTLPSPLSTGVRRFFPLFFGIVLGPVVSFFGL